MDMRENKRKNEIEILDGLYNVFEKSILYEPDVAKCFNKIKNYSNELFHHSLNVAILSVVLGIHHYHKQQTLEELFVSALFHDYGKIFISRCILEKTDTLTLDERKTIELHSIAGYFYLKQETKFNERMLNAILDHHERVDGSGYGLCKDSGSISDYAKIIAISDVYDAMISDRIYRKSLDRNIVMEYMIKNCGKQFESALANEFLGLIKVVDIDYIKRKVWDKMNANTNYFDTAIM